MKTVKKFAWFPTVAFTWRSGNRKALVWLQSYWVEGVDQWSVLGTRSDVGRKYVTRIGLFSIEF